ncbi:HEAT repeat domain-containing protein [Haloferula sp.]|uniref:HEAT repeat domain-containing protein n=1 Tax=Haloferula sp. TaxID=2497595 RepID=UPI00329E375E
MNAAPIQSEASQLAILASDASDHDKAVACQLLVYVAGPKSITPLAALLGHERLSDYARSGLEVIEDTAASQALIAALSECKGRQRAGVVHSLGVRREAKAIPDLKKLAADPAGGVQLEAIAALGMIGSPEAVSLLEPIITKGQEPLKSAAGHAALVAAEHLASEGEPDASKQLSGVLITAFPKGPINDAAKHLNSGQAK